MSFKIFIDGQEGTTGLKIFDRFKKRNDLEVLIIDQEKRKDINTRLEIINEADITFLCLPDVASKEIVERVSSNTRILDTSTAFRINKNWTYGLPELSSEQRDKIKSSNRVAVPGCHATGFILLVNPLITLGIADKDYPFTCHSITGYSGGGKNMISQYDEVNKENRHKSPRQYGLDQRHKHLPEMTAITKLSHEPIFNPIVADYYSGMQVTVPIHRRLLKRRISAHEFGLELADFYKNQPLIKVMEYGMRPDDGFLSANELANTDGLQIYIFGNDEQIVLVARYDNLGKGASGAAIQCMNIMLGLPEDMGLFLV